MKAENIAEHIINKYGLTFLQYYGGNGLTPKDNCIISNALLCEYGNINFGVPPVCTAQWGFESWAKFIGKIQK